jgi:hypothetical protein
LACANEVRILCFCLVHPADWVIRPFVTCWFVFWLWRVFEWACSDISADGFNLFLVVERLRCSGGPSPPPPVSHSWACCLDVGFESSSQWPGTECLTTFACIFVCEICTFYRTRGILPAHSLTRSPLWVGRWWRLWSCWCACSVVSWSCFCLRCRLLGL